MRVFVPRAAAPAVRAALAAFAVFRAGALALGMAACIASSYEGHATCTQVGKCGGGDALTSIQVTACSNDLADKACGTKYQILLDCRAKNEVCLDGGGRDDTATFNACASESADWLACMTPPDAGSD